MARRDRNGTEPQLTINKVFHSGLLLKGQKMSLGIGCSILIMFDYFAIVSVLFWNTSKEIRPPLRPLRFHTNNKAHHLHGLREIYRILLLLYHGPQSTKNKNNVRDVFNSE